jgi:hypothetical protein
MTKTKDFLNLLSGFWQYDRGGRHAKRRQTIALVGLQLIRGSDKAALAHDVAQFR